MDNDQLCNILPDFDIFVVHSQAWELSKAVLEALLSGLPVIINKREGYPVPELKDAPVILVENTVDGYAHAIHTLVENNDLRRKLGNEARNYASKRWASVETETRFAAIYREVLQRKTL
jgi:glycosyltransferase involved in cell wall biosynthesis